MRRSPDGRAGELLEYIGEHKRRLGFSPTLAETAQYFDRSPTWVREGMQDLLAGGLIVHGGKRGIITITQSGWEALRLRMQTT